MDRKDIIDEAFRQASSLARERFYQDATKQWSPYIVRYETFGLELNLDDPLVRELRLDDKKNAILESIVFTVFKDLLNQPKYLRVIIEEELKEAIWQR